MPREPHVIKKCAALADISKGFDSLLTTSAYILNDDIAWSVSVGAGTEGLLFLIMLQKIDEVALLKGYWEGTSNLPP